MQSPANDTFTVNGIGVAEGSGVAAGSVAGVGTAVGLVVVSSSATDSDAAIEDTVRSVLTVSVTEALKFLKAQPAKTATARVIPAVIIVLRNVVLSELKCLIS